MVYAVCSMVYGVVDDACGVVYGTCGVVYDVMWCDVVCGIWSVVWHMAQVVSRWRCAAGRMTYGIWCMMGCDIWGV